MTAIERTVGECCAGKAIDEIQLHLSLVVVVRLEMVRARGGLRQWLIGWGELLLFEGYGWIIQRRINYLLKRMN